jgi:hypothetical protein
MLCLKEYDNDGTLFFLHAANVKDLLLRARAAGYCGGVVSVWKAAKTGKELYTYGTQGSHDPTTQFQDLEKIIKAAQKRRGLPLEATQ